MPVLKSGLGVAFRSALLCLVGCTSYLSDGSMVRHHLGYVRIVVPPRQAEAPIESLEVSTLGIWFQPMETVDGPRNTLGLGFLEDRRDYLPLDCRVVLRVKNQEQLRQAMAMVRSQQGREAICATVER